MFACLQDWGSLGARLPPMACMLAGDIVLYLVPMLWMHYAYQQHSDYNRALACAFLCKRDGAIAVCMSS